MREYVDKSFRNKITPKSLDDYFRNFYCRRYLEEDRVRMDFFKLADNYERIIKEEQTKLNKKLDGIAQDKVIKEIISNLTKCPTNWDWAMGGDRVVFAYGKAWQLHYDRYPALCALGSKCSIPASDGHYEYFNSVHHIVNDRDLHDFKISVSTYEEIDDLIYNPKRKSILYYKKELAEQKRQLFG